MKTFKLSDYVFAVFIAALVLIFLIYCTGCDNKPTKIQVDKYMALYKIGYTNGINSALKAETKDQLDVAYKIDTVEFRKFLENGYK